jgi:hypothetical protein
MPKTDYQLAIDRVIGEIQGLKSDVAASARSSADRRSTANIAPTTRGFEAVSIASIAAQAAEMFAALPESERSPMPRGCSGLPRVYPKFWMKLCHSNSLMFEFKQVQNKPSNGLKSWKE